MKTATITIFIALALFATVATFERPEECDYLLCAISTEPEWVCGNDGKTYVNQCELDKAIKCEDNPNLKKAKDGEC